MRPAPKVNKRTLPKRKLVAVAKPATKKTKVKVKAKFNLKGIPAKYKLICNLAIEHADTQTQCDQLLLVGVSVYETLLETHPLEIADKLKQEAVTKAMLLQKETYSAVS
jgi:hypothetical protein